MRDATGNLPVFPGIFADCAAPIVRNAPDGVRELATARWGMPSSQKALLDATAARAKKLEAKGKTVDFKELLKMEPDEARVIRFNSVPSPNMRQSLRSTQFSM